jgi:hypothetical protein
MEKVMPLRTQPDVAPLDIGEPDDAFKALVEQIDAYFDAPTSTAAERLARIRAGRYLRQIGYIRWVRALARGHFVPRDQKVRLVDMADVSGMVKSSVQQHVDIGLTQLPDDERQDAERIADEMKARRGAASGAA